MRRRSQAITNLIVFVTAALMAVAVGWWIARRVTQSESVVHNSPEQPERPPSRRVAHLYFGDAQGHYLMAEQRVLDQPVDDVAFARQLVELLIKGPEKGGSRTLPVDARVRAAYLNDTGTAYIDFEDDAFDGHPGGVGAELLSIYSLVNTLVLNVDHIRSVKILIGGRESVTLAGHADLQTPFEVDMLWVR